MLVFAVLEWRSEDAWKQGLGRYYLG
ncbi:MULTISPECIES: rpoE leader peptide RseD [unclassified Enterobacter]|nr:MULTISPECIES: rpoE leader peptide RseD [unclassified Enterobacter]HKS33477.1 rpoE leader peptide RseD [Enterobacteriaceae bacterium]